CQQGVWFQAHDLLAIQSGTGPCTTRGDRRGHATWDPGAGWPGRMSAAGPSRRTWTANPAECAGTLPIPELPQCDTPLPPPGPPRYWQLPSGLPPPRPRPRVSSTAWAAPSNVPPRARSTARPTGARARPPAAHWGTSAALSKPGARVATFRSPAAAPPPALIPAATIR